MSPPVLFSALTVRQSIHPALEAPALAFAHPMKSSMPPALVPSLPPMHQPRDSAKDEKTHEYRAENEVHSKAQLRIVRTHKESKTHARNLCG